MKSFFLASALLLPVMLFGENVLPKMVKREITVSIIGMDHARRPEKVSDEVEYMIQYWIAAMNREIGNKPDLIVLPEISDFWQWMPKDDKLRSWIDKKGNRILEAFQNYAREHHCYLVYPAYQKIGENQYTNSAILIDRNGQVVTKYDKIYETIRGVGFGVRPGSKPVVVETDFGRIGFVICFDLNFWDLMEAYAKEKPDILVFCSYYDGSFMRQAWAHRCQSYLIAATVGELPKTIVGPSGEILREERSYFRTLSHKINTNYKVVHLDNNFGKLQAAVDKYGENLTIRNPGGVGVVTLLSNKPEIPVSNIIREFQIESWEEYYERSKAVNEKARSE